MSRAGISSTYISFVQNNTRALVAHLYSFQSAAGSIDRFTDLDFDVVWNSVTWVSSSLRIDGLRRKTAVGLEVDEQEVKIYALPTDTIFGANFLTAAETGILDGAQVTRLRAVWQITTGNLIYDVINSAPIQVWTMFVGFVSDITRGGQTHIEMKVKSPLVKLEVNMPRNYYQPGCLWTLYDSGCTLIKTNFTITSTVGSGSNSSSSAIFPATAPPNPTGADGIATYAQGRLLFTSGVNSGLQVLIDNNDTNYLYLASPLVVAPAVGDGIQYFPGCSKSYNTCDKKFANKANFRGFDKVPPIAISI